MAPKKRKSSDELSLIYLRRDIRHGPANLQHVIGCHIRRYQQYIATLYEFKYLIDCLSKRKYIARYGETYLHGTHHTAAEIYVKLQSRYIDFILIGGVDGYMHSINNKFGLTKVAFLMYQNVFLSNCPTPVIQNHNLKRKLFDSTATQPPKKKT